MSYHAVKSVSYVSSSCLRIFFEDNEDKSAFRRIAAR